MNELVRKYIESMREHSIMDNLCEAVDKAIFPFRPGRITAHINESLNRERVLIVEVQNLPEHHFVMSMDVLSLTREPDGGLSKIYERVFKHYRFRSALPVDDHIILGDG